MATDVRLRVLPRMDARPHRYVWWRYLSQGLTVGILFAVPLTGLARVDLFSGEHRLLFDAATWREGLAGVILAIAACYVLTFVLNVVFGRMFCGWGCPVGFLNRLSDVRQMKHRKDAPRAIVWRDRLGPLGHAILLSVSCTLWWTAPVAFVAFDRPEAMAWAWGVAGSGVVFLWWLGRWPRWRFCETTCPIGLYYSFVAPADRFGIHFREATSDGQRDACLHCNACIHVCPVDLDPMNLAAPASPRGGLGIEDAPGWNHCLKCGDCIQACELMIDLAAERRGIDEVPLRFGFFEGPQRVERGDATPIDLSSGDEEPESNEAGEGSLRPAVKARE